MTIGKVLPVGKDQREWNVEAEGREKAYKLWRKKIDCKYVMDIDTFEYIYIGEKLVPVAFIEISKAESTIVYPERYLPTVDKNRKGQMTAIRNLANLVGCPAFYVMFEEKDGKLYKIYARCLTEKNSKWKESTPEQWENILKKLRKRV